MISPDTSSARRPTWLEVDSLCRQALELSHNVQLSIREYPGLHVTGGYLSWLVLHDLKDGGERSIGDLVHLRPATREWVRRLVGELVNAGFAEFVPNPHRRKSRLVRITLRGQSMYMKVTEDLERFATALPLRTEQITSAFTTIQQINSALSMVIDVRRQTTR